jgi:hypothetical protein
MVNISLGGEGGGGEDAFRVKLEADGHNTQRTSGSLEIWLSRSQDLGYDMKIAVIWGTATCGLTYGRFGGTC